MTTQQKHQRTRETQRGLIAAFTVAALLCLSSFLYDAPDYQVLLGAGCMFITLLLILLCETHLFFIKINL